MLKVFIGIILAFLTLLVGCGLLVGSATEDIAKEQDKHAITQQQAASVAIGTPKSTVIKTLGAPASSQQFSDSYSGDTSCIYYNVKNGEFLDSWQFCFDNEALLESKNKW